MALKRAFEVFEEVDDKRGKVLLLMTDGGFAGVSGGSRYKGMKGNEAVLKWLADNNKNGEVTIKTFLYDNGRGEVRAAKEVMDRIAREHGSGRAKLIIPDERR